MHWLPLVAMVIASALPFPQSPLPRIVAATTDSSRNFDNHSLDSSSSEAGSRTPVKVPVDYNSHGNVSQKDYSMAVRKEGEASQQKAVDHHVQSTLEDLSSLSHKKQGEHLTKGKHNKKSFKPKHILLNSNTDPGSSEQQGGTDGESVRGQVTGHDSHGSRGKTESLTKLGLVETGLLVAETTSNSMHDSLPLSGAYISEPSADLTQTDSDTGGNKLKQRGATEESRGQEATEDAGEAREEVGLGLVLGLGHGGLQADEDFLFLDLHPRVLFSSSPLPPKDPPLLLMRERDLLSGEGVETGEDGSGELWDGDEADEADGAGSYHNVLLGRTDTDAPGQLRSRRSLSPLGGGRELSVCDEQSDWVKSDTAVDIHQHTVSIVPEIRTQTGPIKQYFYETRCREDPHRSAPASGCRGVDKRQWNSSCQTKQSFVQALIQDGTRRKWSWIRINSSCVCVLLSRVKRPHRMVGVGTG